MIIKKIKKRIRKQFDTAYQKIKKIRKKRSNINILLTTMAVVMIWRWVWWLLDKFLFPGYEVLSYLIGMLMGIFLLFVDDERLDELWDKSKNEEKVELKMP
jgi:F0F1-type ATP synthase assembly protein I